MYRAPIDHTPRGRFGGESMGSHVEGLLASHVKGWMTSHVRGLMKSHVEGLIGCHVERSSGVPYGAFDGEAM